jgi:hypothetical protein
MNMALMTITSVKPEGEISRDDSEMSMRLTSADPENPITMTHPMPVAKLFIMATPRVARMISRSFQVRV